MPRKNPEDRRIQFSGGGSLRSRLLRLLDREDGVAALCRNGCHHFYQSSRPNTPEDLNLHSLSYLKTGIWMILCVLFYLNDMLVTLLNGALCCKYVGTVRVNGLNIWS